MFELSVRLYIHVCRRSHSPISLMLSSSFVIFVALLMVLVSLEILPVHWHCQEMHGPAADGISANVQLANIWMKANNYTNIDGINHNNTVRLIKSLQMNVEKTVFADKLKVAVYWCIMQSSN